MKTIVAHVAWAAKVWFIEARWALSGTKMYRTMRLLSELEYIATEVWRREEGLQEEVSV